MLVLREEGVGAYIIFFHPFWSGLITESITDITNAVGGGYLNSFRRPPLSHSKFLGHF